MQENTKKPHVHCEVIKLWADGAEIEWRLNDLDNWRSVINPSFYEDYQYRVKKTIVTKYLYAYSTEPSKEVRVSNIFYKDDDEFLKLNSRIHKFERIDFTAEDFEE